MPKSVFAFLLLACASLSAHAQDADKPVPCGITAPDIQRWARAVGYKPKASIDKVMSGESLDHSTLEASTAFVLCKDWPLRPGLRVAFITMPEALKQQDDFSLDALALVLDMNRQVIAIRLERGFLNSDADRLMKVRLDTARYQLGADVAAFGVAVSHSGSSSVNPFSSGDTTLFALQGKRLTPVSEGFPFSASGGEWDQRCTGDFRDVARTLSIAPEATSGLANLLVRQTGSTTRSRPAAPGSKAEAAGDCVEKKAPLPVQNFVLRFDGTRYVMPKAMTN